jgi:HTH-type transcriptional regulator, sugar sensing transcriptional regulator
VEVRVVDGHGALITGALFRVSGRTKRRPTFLSRRIDFEDSVPVNQERMRKLMDHGLTEYQARAYLTLLDLGAATATQVSPLSKVPRTRIYATMRQLHQKGLVQILPESPLRYKPVPFEAYLKTLAEELRSRAQQIDTGQEALAREFAIVAQASPESAGSFEAIYGRKNVRERLLRMYTTAAREVIGIGTTKSPGRILGAFRPDLVERASQGVQLKYAFCFTPENRDDVRILLRHAQVRHIDFMMPVYMHVVDGKEFLMSHPIPDDDSAYRGDDIAIWTNDPAIAGAMSEMSERIWAMGKPAADVLKEARPPRRVAVTRP